MNLARALFTVNVSKLLFTIIYGVLYVGYSIHNLSYLYILIYILYIRQVVQQLPPIASWIDKKADQFFVSLIK